MNITNIYQWDPCKQHSDSNTKWKHSIGWNVQAKLAFKKRPNDSLDCTAWDYDRSQRDTTVVTEFNLVCKRRYFQPLGWVLYISGEIIGLIIWGLLADRYGRKKILFICLGLQALAGLMAGMVTSLSGVLAMRTALGLFSPGGFIAAILRLEYIGPSMRLIGAVLDCIGSSVGLIVVAILAHFFRDWRQLQIIVSLPGFLFLSCWWYVPESARWYLAQSKERAGKKIVSRMATENRRELTLDTYEADEPEKGNLAALNPLNLCCHSTTRTRLILLSFMWLVNSLAFFNMTPQMPVFTDDLLLHFIINALVQIPAYIICLFTLNRFGKRFPIFFAMIISGGFISSMIAVPTEYSNVTYALVILAKISLLVAFAGIYLFSIELQATVVRAAALGVNASFRAVGELLVPWVALSSEVWQPLPLVICSGLPAFGGLFALCLPETTGKFMPERIQDINKAEEEEDEEESEMYRERDGSISIMVPMRPMKDEEEHKEDRLTNKRNSIS